MNANGKGPSTKRRAGSRSAARKASRPTSVKPTAGGRSGNSAARTKQNGSDGRKRNIMIACVIIAVLVVSLVIGGIVMSQRGKTKEHIETLDVIDNPDQGFYRPSFVALSQDGVKASKPIYDGFALYHLRVDLSAFSTAAGGTDSELTAAALDGLESVIEFYEERERSIILRLAYDKNYGGKKDQEPSVELMTSHIRAVSEVLNRHTDALTAVEVGMVGPWGEMHSSKLATPEVITELTDTYLTALEERPVLVRTPKMVYDYLGITVNDIDGYVEPNGKSKRLGLFNDGYLGSENDLGTYTDREREVGFFGGRENLPYGGEVVVPDSKLHDIDKCVREMALMNLSYLNYEWNSEIVQKKWQKSKYTEKCGKDSLYYGQSAFTYIRNRLGYRFLIKVDRLGSTEDKTSIDLTAQVDNVGFGYLTRKKTVEMLLVDADGKTVGGGVVSREWQGGSINARLDSPDVAAGEYKVYIKVHSGGRYPIRFANKDIYDETLEANFIGTLTI